MKSKNYKVSTPNGLEFFKLFIGTLITLGVITFVLIILSRLV